ncbi:hypothetical protein WJX73_008940 [Symbiochloris irregularis]|uniref:ASCH domain-containing protein n=1 Tax=Symbiochloris irregularis TaxID=706552 RepID=A0AAW1Q0F5_9CHLO
MSGAGTNLEPQLLGLECQVPWPANILSGSKTVELRTYPLRPEWSGRKIWLLETPAGQPGRSSLPDNVPSTEHVKVVGWVVFGGMVHYTNQEDFERDLTRHTVTPGSGSVRPTM